ncbi:MAG TPA: nuclear transport factor 2 family protein [Baekduia sp.]|nr:nuclear transport factor 2 family protein [Baekduia sp.]
MTTDELTTLRDELHALTDRAALTDLVSRMALWLDGRAGGDPEDLFTPDVTASTPGGTVSGRDAIVAQARFNHDMPTHHLIGNVLPAVDGDTATITANITGHFVRAEGTVPGPTELGGRYALGARRTASGWRLSSVAVEPVWRVE